MCGIVGVISQNAASKAFNGLKALEYRGYDSWGMAYPEKGHGILVTKKTGQIGKASPDFPMVGIAMGHTRWATHGKVTEKNAHPHFSMDKTVAIVHNGIVENFAELKSGLVSKGYSFKSETDSEVIANLIQEKLKAEKNFEDAVRKTVLELEGNYAIVVMRRGEDKLVCARNGSPLVIGIAQGGYFAASDATAFISETKKAVFLNDSTMAVLDKELKVLDTKSGMPVQVLPKELSWSFEQAQKGSYEHFMLKEIFEQPALLKNAAQQQKEPLAKFVSMIKNAKKIYFAGCGTSYHACISGAYMFSSIAKTQVLPVLASEFSLQENFVDENTLVVAVSQSGETADLIEAINIAKEKGAKIAGIVNVMDSTVMRLSDATLLMNAGPEICVLSTKSYTMQLAILLLLAYSIVGKEAEAKALLSRLSQSAQQILDSNSEKIKEIAKELSRAKDIFVIGRKNAFPTALETALKIKEVSYIHAEGFAGAELKHGTIALVEEGTPAIVLSTSQTRKQVASNAIEMRSRGAKIIMVDSIPHSDFDFSILVPDFGEANPIALVLPMQLLAYYIALERKLDPDKPRNLAKSVTVK
ncbi:MAG: glutamine--fructose-6-phosphate transaminase (isomerizing) [archaeon]